MTSLRALAPAALTMMLTVPALAQAPWPSAAPPQQQTAPWPSSNPPAQQSTAPWPDANGRPQQAAPQFGGEPPCMKDFMALRGVAEKRANAIRTASERKATPQEACGLFKAMYEAEHKFVKFAADQGQSCGIPQEIVKQLGENLKKTTALRTQICNAAAQGPARPAAPNLSDALSAPVTNSGNVRTGRGTFDTLTGTPLGRSAQ